jgi:U3 small nucleolar RNA-associated protein 12
VRVIQRCQDRESIAVGYSNGDINIFNYISKTLTATLHGHRTAVLTLASDQHSSYLASGGADNDIYIWDLITLTAVCKLRGHRDAITGRSYWS